MNGRANESMNKRTNEQTMRHEMDEGSVGYDELVTTCKHLLLPWYLDAAWQRHFMVGSNSNGFSSSSPPSSSAPLPPFRLRFPFPFPFPFRVSSLRCALSPPGKKSAPASPSSSSSVSSSGAKPSCSNGCSAHGRELLQRGCAHRSFRDVQHT